MRALTSYLSKLISCEDVCLGIHPILGVGGTACATDACTLIRHDSVHRFGAFEETISSVLGKNQRAGTLSSCGKMLAGLLDKIDEGHCIKSIIDT